MLYEINASQPFPLGCSIYHKEGKIIANFALFSSAAKRVQLCLFDENEQETRFDMQLCEGNVWCVTVGNIVYGMQYGYRLYGKDEDSLCNPNKLMLDPYAKAVVGKPDLSSSEKCSWFDLTDCRDNASLAPKALIVDCTFDWQGDQCLATPWQDTIIYELNVKGFTQLREDLPESIRGSYAALGHSTMIDYLKDLGVTAVELLPVNYQLDEVHLQEKGLHNYWGYNPLAMFAVEPKYATSELTALTEFKQMVRSLHQAGIEVILDVVFNHSAESEKHFPTFSQRGIDDKTYYWQSSEGQYYNWTGCGNTLNLSHKVTRDWVVDCLRYWVEECHIDGFRFDLGAVLGREGEGGFNSQAQLFTDIMAVPSLQKCKFIAEPWDIGDFGYQVGNFPPFFAEWNDRFRDDMTKFWLWKNGEKGAFAQRLAGSSDIFQHTQRQPYCSINFITAHDGFTLRDLVSYNQKQNWANGEENRDGRNENHSYDHGFEGVDNAPQEVEKARLLSSINLLTSLLLSNGTPMLLAGDEFGNSQWGNNNAYCQDNLTSWLKWETFNQKLFSITKQLIALRKKIALLGQSCWWNDDNICWLNSQAQLMSVENWHNAEDKALQVLIENEWLFLINSKTELQTFLLPRGNWEVMYCATEVVLQENIAELNDVSFCVLRNLDS
ncbi:glycogen debranching protein GlgX [[Haemophilus] felis]|uniref:Glycogen debranching enzyme GlgX n=1 Tax=[Haemophilus] felis TaxID=123822 RepID=A0A1T0B6Y5_9PAST|nr:glycogen debranching protein GlgX [[Haemophilus] felis]OOS05776.1 glycogen debranching enzyme GlgX [[Haemophilus] felis]